MRILEFSSYFPLATSKWWGNFLVILVQKIAQTYSCVVLTSKQYATDPNYSNENLTIYRHKQFLWGSPQLAYGGGMLSNLQNNPLLYVTFPFFLFYQLRELRRVIKREDITLIHAHWLIPQGFIAAVYKRFFDHDIKILVTSHGSDINKLNGTIATLIKKFTLSMIDHITVVSIPLKEKLRQSSYVKPISVIPMGINTETFSPKTQECIFDKQHKHILFVGRFSEEKGLVYLIQAMPSILRAHPQTHLTLIGDGQLREKIQVMVRDFKLEQHVTFKGFLPNSDLPAYYSQADLVVMPSLNEGSPVVLPEALACGAIVLTSDLPVYQQHIQHGISGFLSKRANSQDIAAKTIDILNRLEALQFLRHQSREYVVKHFDWDVIGQQYIELLEQLEETI